jgi:hypothetical protein
MCRSWLCPGRLLFLAGVAPCLCGGFGVLAGSSVGLDRACATVSLCRRLFLVGLVAACTTDTRAGPEGVNLGDLARAAWRCDVLVANLLRVCASGWCVRAGQSTRWSAGEQGGLFFPFGTTPYSRLINHDHGTVAGSSA